MRKSLFKKYLRITSFTILISFCMLGMVMLAFISQNWQSEKQQLLRKNAENVAAIVTQSARQQEDGSYTLSSEDVLRLQWFVAAFAQNAEMDLLVYNKAGMPVAYATSGGNDIDPVVLDENLMEKVFSKLGYHEQGTLGGLYGTPHYVVGTAIRTMDSHEIIGAVFATSGIEAFADYRGDLLKMFVLAALAAFFVSFCIVYLFSYNLVRPLRDMAYAARCFGEGNFSVRVPVTSQDEVGQLAVAFNNMASSLASGESVRRNFIANVSHELKTPMTTIAGFIDGILDGTIPSEKQSYYLKIVSQEVKRLSRLVRTMLDLSRIDNGELKLHTSRFDLTGTVLDTLLSFEKPIEDKEIQICGLENAESLFVDGDADMIHQVVYNLVENAVKFTNRSGYIEVRIEDQPERVQICIKNSGPGIAPDEVPLIFDRFYKTDKSRSQDRNGMGLGLYIVRTIIKLHGGEITVSSVQNEFCQFRFWLPKSNAERKESGRRIEGKQ